MNCPSCQTENPDGAKFCMSCGSKLQLTCPACATPLPVGAKFCFNCGHQMGASAPPPPIPAPPPAPAPPPPTPAPVATAPVVANLDRFIPRELMGKLQSARSNGAMVGERRIVTMLFCDVKGSTAAAGQLDPEEWAEIINGAFEFMIKPVYKYEGTLARLMGDAILAFFGAPIAHEDDPQRAILAGLEIVNEIVDYRQRISRQWGIDISVRVGINTGLVVVGAVGSDLRMEYSALGDAINLAARMEQTAQPGTVQIAEPTYKLVAPLFDVKPLGSIEVKGKDEPVPAYQVLAAKVDPGRLRGIQGLESPLVGRDAEFQTLGQALTDLEQGHGGIVSLVAEAGLGKSRLVAEVRNLAPNPHGPGRRWLEGRSLSYETNTPHAPFIDLFTACFGLQPDQTPAEKYAAIAAQAEQMAPGRSSEYAPFIATLLGIPPTGSDGERVRFLEPPDLRKAAFAAVRGYLETLALAQPLVVVFDDVHWIDPSSLELLESLLPLADRVPILIVALFRPHRQEPSWRFHESTSRDFSHRYQAIFLKPLDAGESRQLVANLLHVEDLPDRVRQLIMDKAEGNPFFVEEVIRSLLDAGLIVRQDGHWHAIQEIHDITVPDTLSAVITTRLDRLDEDLRAVVQAAAVIGRQFKLSTLEAIHATQVPLDGLLSELQRRELVREKTRLPERVYIFKHAMTQETAYNSLLLRSRREMHLRVAGVLERSTPDGVVDLAHHFLSAREPGRALPYLVQAGERAARSYASQEAIRFFEQAQEVLDPSQDIALARRAYEGLGGALTFANVIPRTVQVYEEMLALGERAGDIPTQVSALNKLSLVTAMRLGRFAEANDYLLEADRRARANEDKAGLSEMGLIRCMMCTFAADFDGVIRYMDEIVQLGAELGVKAQMTLGHAHIASSQTYLLQFDRALQTVADGVALCREIGDRLHEAELLGASGALVHMAQGRFDLARSWGEEGLAIARQIGSVIAQLNCFRILGIIAIQRGEYESAIEHFQAYLDASEKFGAPWSQAEAFCLLGTAYLDISTELLDRVFGFHGKAKVILEQPAGNMMGATAWAELGFCLRAAGYSEDAKTLFLRGLEIPTITSNLERPRLLVGAALAALDLRDADAARNYVALAHDYAQEHGLVYLHPLVAYAQGCVAEGRGETDAALAALARAERKGQSLGMRPLIWQARACAARVLRTAGRTEEAGLQAASAWEMAQEIGAIFQNPELSATFLAYAQARIYGDKPTGQSTEPTAQRDVPSMTGQTNPACTHLDQMGDFPADGKVCPQCVEMGSHWVNLRQCLICGQVGCCDSSPNTHATKHFQETGHPLMRSLQPGDSWLWCYVDEVLISDHPAGV
ncbi:MAG: zinc-ribbon domain-containing protein [Chloroflexi bacterium]|nr:MAG: zinc-ribbon domain-containing protein [Chloroflexota bacterium]